LPFSFPLQRERDMMTTHDFASTTYMHLMTTTNDAKRHATPLHTPQHTHSRSSTPAFLHTILRTSDSLARWQDHPVLISLASRQILLLLRHTLRPLPRTQRLAVAHASTTLFSLLNGSTDHRTFWMAIPHPSPIDPIPFSFSHLGPCFCFMWYLAGGASERFDLCHFYYSPLNSSLHLLSHVSWVPHSCCEAWRTAGCRGGGGTSRAQRPCAVFLVSLCSCTVVNESQSRGHRTRPPDGDSRGRPCGLARRESRRPGKDIGTDQLLQSRDTASHLFRVRFSWPPVQEHDTNTIA